MAWIHVFFLSCQLILLVVVHTSLAFTATIGGNREILTRLTTTTSNPIRITKMTSNPLLEVSLGDRDERQNDEDGKEEEEESKSNGNSLSTSSISSSQPYSSVIPLGPISSWLTRIGMMSFIISMCIALPLTLLSQRILLDPFRTKVQSEQAALATGQFCARWLLRIIPFCKIHVTAEQDIDPEPSIWVCNHQSMLDVFILLAVDRDMRGPNKRPIKIVYWKQLEKNFVTKLLFQQCGFIPVEMADNGNGNENEYDISSFRSLLRLTKQAIADGFDIGILPEGQLNPHPEEGLLPVYSGAYTLARMSRRPIGMMALHGVQNLWHPIHGMHCIDNTIQVRAYGRRQTYVTQQDFCHTFEHVVGYFGQTGRDTPDLANWIKTATKQPSLSMTSSSSSLPSNTDALSNPIKLTTINTKRKRLPFS